METSQLTYSVALDGIGPQAVVAPEVVRRRRKFVEAPRETAETPPRTRPEL